MYSSVHLFGEILSGKGAQKSYPAVMHGAGKLASQPIFIGSTSRYHQFVSTTASIELPNDGHYIVNAFIMTLQTTHICDPQDPVFPGTFFFRSHIICIICIDAAGSVVNAILRNGRGLRYQLATQPIRAHDSIKNSRVVSYKTDEIGLHSVKSDRNTWRPFSCAADS